MSNSALIKNEPKSPEKKKASALELMASRLSVDPTKLYETLKATVFKGCTNEELLALVVVSNTYGLSPFLKEIYAFPAKGGGVVPVVSIDGWNSIMIRQPDFDGIEFEFVEGEEHPISCTATIYVKNRSKPVKITEYYDECFRETEPWRKMPHRLLRHRALCQGSRIAFGFSGIQEEDEYQSSILVESTIIPQIAEAGEKSPADPKTIPKKIVTSDSKVPDHAAELEAIVMGGGYSFSDLQKFCAETSQMENADSIGSFAEIPQDVAKRLIRAKAGLLAGLEKVKGAA